MTLTYIFLIFLFSFFFQTSLDQERCLDPDSKIQSWACPCGPIQRIGKWTRDHPVPAQQPDAGGGEGSTVSVWAACWHQRPAQCQTEENQLKCWSLRTWTWKIFWTALHAWRKGALLWSCVVWLETLPGTSWDSASICILRPYLGWYLRPYTWDYIHLG